MNAQDMVERLVAWMQQQVRAAGCQGVVFGLSGGVDSAVVAGLAQKAFGEKALGIIMPCHSDPLDAIHAKLCATALGLKTAEVDLGPTYDVLLQSMEADAGKVDRMALANIKPRLRMTTLYFHASLRNALVIGTSNRSEFRVGYFTKHGDSGADMLPLVPFVKAEIYELAEALGVPKDIITKPPSAGLWANQTDEGEMGITYAELDNYILTGQAEPRVKDIVDRLTAISAHKRQLPPSPEFESK